MQRIFEYFKSSEICSVFKFIEVYLLLPNALNTIKQEKTYYLLTNGLALEGVPDSIGTLIFRGS